MVLGFDAGIGGAPDQPDGRKNDDKAKTHGGGSTYNTRPAGSPGGRRNHIEHGPVAKDPT